MDLFKSLSLSSNKGDSGTVKPEGVSFDNSTDYLSRSADLTGNINSKTFTFSCWAYVTSTTQIPLYSLNSYTRFEFSGRGLTINAYAPGSSTRVLLFEPSGAYLPFRNNWVHIIVSCDMANSSRRHAYFNDKSSGTWVQYTNSLIDFTRTPKYVHSLAGGALSKANRLSNLYLDYTYRDLSIEANRRLFITEDLKPANGLGSLSPILYLPMKDPSTAHINQGTGGNFTPNGTLATADRGANQDNCVASEFDGVNDYLSSTGIGASDSKQFTIRFSFKKLSSSNETSVFSLHNGVTFYNKKLSIIVSPYGSGFSLMANGYLDNGTLIFGTSYLVTATSYGIEYDVALSIDLVDSTKSKISINGIVSSITLSTCVNTNFQFSNATEIAIGRYNNGVIFNGTIGELYFDTNYIDLSTNNPFWDSDTNKPIPVRKAISNLGSNPLICMPISADNPTLNLGSGGDFTLNGGELIGARGASEYVARTFKGDGSSGYMLNTSTSLIPSNSKTFSFVACAKDISGTSSSKTLLSIQDSGESCNTFRILVDSSNLAIIGSNSADSIILNISCNDLPEGFEDDFFTLLVSVDLGNGLCNVVVNREFPNKNTTTLTNDLLDIGGKNRNYIGAEENGGNTRQLWQGYEGSAYFTTDYIDFSEEANINLFVSQLGYPRDLQPLINDGIIPNPAIYLPFDDPDNLGKNNGTGGDFTVNGTVSVGQDFTI
jgi:hypothetical protein